MSQFYGMESTINTSRPTLWDTHVSMIKWGSLTLTQLIAQNLKSGLDRGLDSGLDKWTRISIVRGQWSHPMMMPH